MRTVSVLTVLALVLPAAAADDKSPPDGWKEVAGGYKKQAYSVWMPAAGEPADNESSIVSKYRADPRLPDGVPAQGRPPVRGRGDPVAAGPDQGADQGAPGILPRPVS